MEHMKNWECEPSERSPDYADGDVRASTMDIMREQEVIELSCDYCKTDYPVRRAQLAGLLDPS